MSDGFMVDTDVLGHHVGVLRGDAQSVAEGSQAAAVTGTQVSGGAFGLMCAFLAPPVGVAAAALGQQIDSCADLENALADAVGAAADSFEETEMGLADAIRSALAELG